MPVVYSDGTYDSSEKDVVDYGFDCQEIATVSVTFTPAEPEYWEGEVGGAIVLSNKSTEDSTHNWNGKEFWGVIDEDLDIATADDSKALVAVKTGDLQYTLTMNVDDTNNVVDNYDLVQIAFQEWSSGMTDITVVGMDVKDASGNTLISYDANGDVTYVVGDEAPAADDTADEDAADDTAADDTAADTTATTTTTTSADKGSPDTGVEGIAAVAGLALVAGGAVVLSKKRK
jgi:LPXTG-motif cell wall-anchored protein